MRTCINRGNETRKAMNYEDRASHPPIIEVNDDANVAADSDYAASAFIGDPEHGKEAAN